MRRGVQQSAKEYMHAHHVCHRSLGPDSIRLRVQEKSVRKWHVVITDFSYLRTFHEGTKIETSIDKGTGFSSVEMVFKKPYTHACDLYSCALVPKRARSR